MTHDIIFSLFIIFAGAAVLSSLALFTRQSFLVAYIVLGMLVGPWGLRWITNADSIKQIGEAGILFLLFLLGLHLPPQKLILMFRRIVIVAIVSSLFFFGIFYWISCYFGFGHYDSFVIGAALMFSSTIIGIKLLPTTILHHQHTGEVMISILLLQDLIAIVVLLFISAENSAGIQGHEVIHILIGLPTLVVSAFLFEHFVFIRLLRRFDRLQEYMFLMSVAWCLTLAELAHFAGLSAETGAFIAGVILAKNPIALHIAESLKPLRDFFLVLFFFCIGANFNFGFLPEVWLPALFLAGLVLLLKPVVFSQLLKSIGESKQVSWEVGVRLAQGSEFSLLVAYLVSTQMAHLAQTTSYVIQAATILTFVISSYWVVARYPTPISTEGKLRRD